MGDVVTVDLVCPECAATLPSARSECPECGAQVQAPQDGATVTSLTKSNAFQRVADDRGAVLAVIFLALAGFGLPLLWKSHVFSTRAKIVWTVVVLIYTAVIIWLIFVLLQFIAGCWRSLIYSV